MQTVCKGTQGGVVHGAVQLLAVACNKGDCIALVQKPDDVFNILRLLAEFFGKLTDQFFHMVLLFICELLKV